MFTYTFLTKDGTRVQIKAYTPLSAYNKLKAQAHLKDRLTKMYVVCTKDGFSSYDWKTLT